MPKKPVFGYGINNADYEVQPRVNGKQIMCPYYRTWVHMLERCYSPKYHLTRPTYKDCEVCEDWCYFMEFRKWMIQQKWKGMALDKDIIQPGNKIYSPENCAFVTRRTNTLLTDHRSARGEHPQGVTWCKNTNKFLAQCSNGGGSLKHIGYFDTVAQASYAYKKFKYSVIMDVADQQIDDRIANGLRKHAKLIK